MGPADWEAVARAGVREFFASLWSFLKARALRLALLALVIFVLWRCQAVVTTLIGAFVLASAAGAVVDPVCRRAPYVASPTTPDVA